MKVLLSLIPLALLPLMNGCFLGERYYGMTRRISSERPLTDEGIRMAAARIPHIDRFHAVDRIETVPELQSDNPNNVVARYFFKRKYETVMLYVCDKQPPLFILRFGAVGGSHYDRGHIRRSRRLMEEVMDSLLQCCDIRREQIRIEQECTNIPCD